MNKPMTRAAERLRQCVGARPPIRDESPENPPRHRGRLGPRRYRGAAEVFRLHGQQYQGKADEQRIHRNDRRQAQADVSSGITGVNRQQQNILHQPNHLKTDKQKHRNPLQSGFRCFYSPLLFINQYILSRHRRCNNRSRSFLIESGVLYH